MELNGRDKTVLKEGARPLQPPAEILAKAGTVLFREGDLSREIYLVRSGKLVVSRGQGLQQVDLATLGPNAVVGEMSLLDALPRSATVRVAEDSQLLAIAPNMLYGLLQQVIPWMHSLLVVVVHRLREANLKVNQHTVAHPTESFARFLALRSRDWNGKRGQPTYEWFPLLDEYCLCSRMRHLDVQKHVQALAARGLVKLSGNRELVILDPERLDAYREQPGDAS